MKKTGLFNSKPLWKNINKVSFIEEKGNGILWCPRFMEKLTFKECDDQRRFIESCASCSKWFSKKEYIKPESVKTIVKVITFGIGEGVKDDSTEKEMCN